MIEYLVKEYNDASELDYNNWANVQVKILKTLLLLGDQEDAVDAIKTILTSDYNHEYMAVAIPDMLDEAQVSIPYVELLEWCYQNAEYIPLNYKGDVQVNDFNYRIVQKYQVL